MCAGKYKYGMTSGKLQRVSPGDRITYIFQRGLKERGQHANNGSGLKVRE